MSNSETSGQVNVHSEVYANTFILHKMLSSERIQALEVANLRQQVDIQSLQTALQQLEARFVAFISTRK